MDELKRFGVSMEPYLLRQFDDYILRQGYQNRSQAIRTLIKGAVLSSSTIQIRTFMVEGKPFENLEIYQDVMRRLGNIEILSVMQLYQPMQLIMHITVKGTAEQLKLVEQELACYKRKGAEEE